MHNQPIVWGGRQLSGILESMQKITQLLATFIPEQYDLSIVLQRKERVFQGTVTIKGAAPAETPAIQLQSKGLTIDSATLDGKAAAFHHDIDDQLIIEHPEIIEGEHLVVVSFSGKITDTMHGLYPCYYEHDGQKKELLATQFESHHAREVFPCIDEPAAKATFNLTLTTEQGITVLSNMPVASEREENDLLVTRFAETPRMSTYLLAWVVGELHKSTGETESGVEVNVWATKAQPVKSLDFAVDIASRCIDFYDSYFGTPYPLPKSDHVALPDFSSGAMENWGLVTYREIVLLVDPATTALDTRQQAALTISHELSHQWFGNLVTMEWWNDLWLNESFANIMEYIAVDAIEPDWQVWLDHSAHEVVMALRRDALEGVQAIQTDVAHPDEINSLFDPSIVYAKGGRMIRMLQHFIGDEAMQRGLRQYFETYAYKNTIAADLWKCFSDASGKDIVSLMNAWITQPGYPVVHVRRTGDLLELQQEQFFIGTHQPSAKLWPIPLGANSPDIPALLSTSSVEVPYYASLPTPILNLGNDSHYLTHYSAELLPSVLAQLPDMSEIDRMKFLHEQTMLAQAGFVASADILAIISHYREETSEAVWSTIAMALNELKKFVETDEKSEQKLRAFTKELTAPQYKRLGWHPKSTEAESDAKLRSLIVALSLYGENQDALDKAQHMYETTAVEALDANLRSGILAAAVRAHQPTTIIDDLLEAHARTNLSELQEDIASALTTTKKPEVVERLLGLLKNNDIIRRQDVARWCVWLMRNRYGRTKAWQWLRDNWSWIEESFGRDMSFDAFPRYAGSVLMTAQELDEYKAFFLPLSSHPGLKRNIRLGVTELEHRVALNERDGPAVRDALLQL